jgi:hypothetical protein
LIINCPPSELHKVLQISFGPFLNPADHTDMPFYNVIRLSWFINWQNTFSAILSLPDIEIRAERYRKYNNVWERYRDKNTYFTGVWGFFYKNFSTGTRMLNLILLIWVFGLLFLKWILMYLIVTTILTSLHLLCKTQLLYHLFYDFKNSHSISDVNFCAITVSLVYEPLFNVVKRWHRFFTNPDWECLSVWRVFVLYMWIFLLLFFE